MNPNSRLHVGVILVGIALFTFAMLNIHQGSAAVQGVEGIQWLYNKTKNTSINASHTSGGGVINIVRMNITQQNTNWKAYVGNITGLLTLDDGEGATIYDWSMNNITSGEIYVSRHNNVNFNDLNCSNFTLYQNNVTSENSFFGFGPMQIDNVNSTFNQTNHSAFSVGSDSITNSTCPAIMLHSDDTSQAQLESSNWHEVLLADRHGHFVYTALIDPDATGYDNQSYHFQIMLPENGSGSSPTNYYFWAEISSS